MDIASKLNQWELGKLEEEDVDELFQELINSGIVWTLQGVYGRTASELIRAGRCSLPPEGSNAN